MRLTLFNNQQEPKVGDLLMVVNVYDYWDGMYGPRKAVVMEPIELDSSKNVVVIEKEDDDEISNR